MERQELDKLVMKPTSRRRLGKYVILGRLGAGGMGKIYLAFLPGPAGIEKLVVIKRLHSHLTGDKVLVESFLDEARLAMAISHPNVVHTYDVGEVDGRYYMAMEHIDGQNLGALLRTSKRAKKYPESFLWAGMFCSALDGLHAAHTAQDARGRPLNIIHRDVSPQNILIGYDGTPKLVDFGIAKAAMRINETDAGVLKGKYAYMSPEQCEAGAIDARSDVFSAGVVLWEMLAGRRLYKSQHIVKSIDRIMHETPSSPIKYNADCDERLANIALKALEKKPDDRFSSADELKEALADALLDAGKRYRRGELSALMRDLFGDVIDRQRKVLDKVLSGETVPLDDDAETGTGSEGDSESDLLVPNLAPGRDPEPTTPSAVSHSPLVTRESEIGLPPTSTGAAPPAPMTNDRIIARTAPARGPQPIAADDPDDKTGTGTVSYVPLPEDEDEHPKKRAAWLVPAILGVLLLVAGALGGAAFLFVMDTGGDGRGATAVRPEDPAPQDTASAGTESGADVEHNATAKMPGREEATDGTSPGRATDNDDDDNTTDRNTTDGNVADRDPTDLDDDGSRASDRSERRGKTKKKPRKNGRKTKTARAEPTERKTPPAEKKTAAPPDDNWDQRANPTPDKVAAAPAEKPPAAKFGYLTLATVPWTTVFLDGKKLGNTPLNNVKVPAGELKLTLKNRTEAIEQTYFVKITAGQTTKKKLGLK